MNCNCKNTAHDPECQLSKTVFPIPSPAASGESGAVPEAVYDECKRIFESGHDTETHQMYKAVYYAFAAGAAAERGRCAEIARGMWKHMSNPKYERLAEQVARAIEGGQRDA